MVKILLGVLSFELGPDHNISRKRGENPKPLPARLQRFRQRLSSEPNLHVEHRTLLSLIKGELHGTMGNMAHHSMKQDDICRAISRTQYISAVEITVTIPAS